RGTGTVVVTGNGQYTTELRRAGRLGMPEDVSRAINAWPLAVPHAEYAVIGGAFKYVDLLGAPDGRGGQLFVNAWLEMGVARVQVFPGAPQRLSETGPRRAAIAGYNARGIQSRSQVALAFHERQPEARLDSGHQLGAAYLRVRVVKREGRSHG